MVLHYLRFLLDEQNFADLQKKKIHSFYFFFNSAYPIWKQKVTNTKKIAMKKNPIFFDFSRFRFPPLNDLTKTYIAVDTLPKLNQFSHLKSIQTQYHFFPPSLLSEKRKVRKSNFVYVMTLSSLSFIQWPKSKRPFSCRIRIQYLAKLQLWPQKIRESSHFTTSNEPELKFLTNFGREINKMEI